MDSEAIKKYVDGLVTCLELEEFEQRKKINYLDSRISEALNNLVVTSCNFAPYDLVYVNFGYINKKNLRPHSIRQGDVVIITVKGNDETILDNEFTGCVESVRDNAVSVMFDSLQQFSAASSHIFRMTQVVDDGSWKRMKNAVQHLLKLPANTKALTEALFTGGTLEKTTLPPALLDSEGKLMFFNETLHAAQKEAVELSLKQKNFGIIHGPPGTGKTTALVELICQLVKSGEKVLVCAPSNVAVDNIMSKLQKYKLKIVRLGHLSRVSEENRPLTTNAYFETSFLFETVKEAKMELRAAMNMLASSQLSQQERAMHRTKIVQLKYDIHRREIKLASEALLGIDVCFSTLGSSYRSNILRYFPPRFFSSLVIDEASQSLEASCWMAIPYAERTILAGDHHQLSPMILSHEAAQMGLSTTLMERAIETLGSDCLQLLTHQFRMNKMIMDWVSKEMYGSQLTADLSVANHLLADIEGVDEIEETTNPMLLVDTSGCGFQEHCIQMSYGNTDEAHLVAYMADLLVKTGVTQQSIAVITPYNKQVELIREALSNLSIGDVEVKTVDGFQGRECEAVILSLVRSNPGGEIGFVADRRRINVAVSRARRFLCVVADSSTVGKDETIASLIQHIRQHGKVRSAHEMRNDVASTAAEKSEVNGEKSGTKKRKKKKKVSDDSDDLVTYQNYKEKLLQFVGSNEPTLLISKLKGFQSLKVVIDIERLTLEYEVLGDKHEECCIRVKKNMTKESAAKELGKQSVQEPKVVPKTWDPKVFETKLLQFLSSDKTILKFPRNLNAAQRACVHEQAEKLGLLHASVGMNEIRHIVVSKPLSEVKEDSEGTQADAADLVSKHHGLKTLLQEFMRSKDTVIRFEPGLSDGQALYLKKEMEALGLTYDTASKPCTVYKKQEELNNETELEIAETLSNISLDSHVAPTRRSKKKKSKQPLLPVEEPTSDDSDKFLDELVKASGLCASAKCKTSVRLIGHDCPHCKQRYCITHLLPEVHGCAAQAKKEARKEFVHPKPKALSDDKRKALEKSLKLKLAAKTDLRTASKKK